MADKSGFMTPEQAERAIWSYYWQLDQSRDRRSSPIQLEPPDHMTEEEVAKLKARQTPLHQKAMLKAVDLMQRRGGRAGGALLNLGKRLFTEKAQAEYFRQATREAMAEEVANTSTSGTLDPNTGLPRSEGDLQSGRGVVSGVDLCMEAIVPPRDLAEAATTWLPPCPPDENETTWGSQLDHWQAMAFKPKELFCVPCRGQGFTVVQGHNDRKARGIFVAGDNAVLKRATCVQCHGKGAKDFWTADEHLGIKHNARTIGERVHELSREGYFNPHPIDSKDVEMGDLVWVDKGGMTIGFRLTWQGYQRMKEYCAGDPEIQQAALHVLTLAGRSVRDAAPEWAQKEYKQAKALQVSTGGFNVTTGGKLAL